MKKIISLMLVLSVAFSALALSGCDGDKREENGQNTSSSSTKSSKTSQKKKEEEKPMEVSVDEKKPRINHDQLSELNARFKSSIDSLVTSESALNAMWDGEAKAAFVNAVHSDMVMLEDLISALEKYTTSTDTARGNYDRCEKDVSSIVSSLKV